MSLSRFADRVPVGRARSLSDQRVQPFASFPRSRTGRACLRGCLVLCLAVEPPSSESPSAAPHPRPCCADLHRSRAAERRLANERSRCPAEANEDNHTAYALGQVGDQGAVHQGAEGSPGLDHQQDGCEQTKGSGGGVSRGAGRNERHADSEPTCRPMVNAACPRCYGPARYADLRPTGRSSGVSFLIISSVSLSIHSSAVGRKMAPDVR